MNDPKKILLRVDAGGEIGLGHFFRSLSLADLLDEKGFKILFVHKNSDFWDNLRDFRYKHFGFPAFDVDEKMLEICQKEHVNILFIDGIIEFQQDFFETIKGKTKIVFYQNISESRALADIFILPSIHQHQDFYNPFFESGTKVYKGLEYFTFNSKIKELPPKKVQENSPVREVGILAGGSDPKNTLLNIYSLIDFTKWKEIKFNFFYGTNYIFKNLIPTILPQNVAFVPFEPKVILKSDFIISAFGVSVYEFLALGMPILSFGHQKSNNSASAFLAKKTGAIIHMGLIDELDQSIVENRIGNMVNSYHLRKKLNIKGASILDLKGAERVVDIINES